MLIRRFITLLCVILALTLEAHAVTLDKLARNDVAHGFRATARLLNDMNKPMGARFVHEKTGFTFDVLQVPSVPQGFVWVRSWPTSDKGEPHTQEHLLLGKGNKGKYASNLEGMSLVQSSAYTEQWHTCYHFYTIAGVDVFFNVLKEQIDALLHPDYSDEEIRREVCNFGVTDDPETHVARLEEKGTVYNEMVSAYERPWSRMERAMGHMLYGAQHPLSYESGGLPEAIRTMTPQDIRTFHANTYHLANMGMVCSFAPDVPLDDVLERMDNVLTTIQDTRPQRVMTEADLPAPVAAAAATIRIVDYPDRNERRPSPLQFAWPAVRTLDSKEKLLIDLFMASLAGDATTTFYKMFVDTRTRTMDIGAHDVWAWVSDDQGHPVYMGFSNVDPSVVNDEKIAAVRKRVVDELARIAALPDDAPELIMLNDRIQNRVTETRRAQSKFVNSPPGFGFRGGGTGSAWRERIDALTTGGPFDVSVTLAAELAFVDSLLARPGNVWRDYITKWKLTDVPYAVAGKPSAVLLRKEAEDRGARSAAEVARLMKQYAVNDSAQAIAMFRREYDKKSAELDSVTALVPTPHFIDHPPLTLDDGLQFSTSYLPPLTSADAEGDKARHQYRHVVMHAGTFENMAGASMELATRVYNVPPRWNVYLSLLPELLTEVGVIENGTPVRYDDMRERLRKEILGISAGYKSATGGFTTELVVSASGNTLDEAKRAANWMNNVLYHPDWRPENLPRLRDVVEQSLSGLRNTMQGSEESWVHDPAEAYRRQRDPVFLATQSFLTKQFNAQRLRWLLKEPPDPAGMKMFSAYMTSLKDAGRSGGRAALAVLVRLMQGDTSLMAQLPRPLRGYMGDLGVLPKAARMLAIEAAKDLELSLGGIPDESLAADWDALCTQMLADLQVPPRTVLKQLDSLRGALQHTELARMVFTGSTASREALAPALASLCAGMDTSATGMILYASDASRTGVSMPDVPLITRRLAARTNGGATPMFVGLVNANTQSGVFLNSAPILGYASTNGFAPAQQEHNLERFLATKLYGGHGAHSMFMKTWAAGLAYSNGLSSSALRNRVLYYAERCPELPQTISFVINELKKATPDPRLAEYAIAQVFGESRAAESFEARTAGMAHQLAAEGLTQDMIAHFRSALLELRSKKDLGDSLFAMMPHVYGSVLPGYDKKYLDANYGTYYVIGSEKQMKLYEAYLKSAVGPDAVLYRLYPRDYWIMD